MSVSSGTLKVGIAAIVVGLIGAYGVRTWLLSNEKPVAAPTPPRPPVSVPVAGVDLPEDRVVAEGDIVFIQMTSQQMRDRAWALDEVMLAGGQIIGRRLKAPAKKGEPFLTSTLYLQGEVPNIAKLLKPGYRAARLEISDLNGGNVLVGTIVDVIFRSSVTDTERKSTGIPEMTVTLLHAIEVLDVQTPNITRLQAVVGYVAKNPIVTLHVTPKQAKVLQTVEGKGVISLVARPKDEFESTPSPFDEAMTLAQVLNIKPPPEPEPEPEPEPPPPPPTPPPPPKMHHVQIYRRGEVNVLAFPADEAVVKSTDTNLKPATSSPISDPVDDLPATPSGDEDMTPSQVTPVPNPETPDSSVEDKNSKPTADP